MGSPLDDRPYLPGEEIPDENYKPFDNLEFGHVVRSALVILVAIFCGCLIGFVAGFKFFKETHECPAPTKHQIGYSVIDSSTIRTCCGEIRKFHWQQTMKQ